MRRERFFVVLVLAGGAREAGPAPRPASGEGSDA